MKQREKLEVFRVRLNEQLKGRNNTEFAAAIGMSRITVGLYLNGERTPDANTLKRICERCGVSANYLLGLSDTGEIDDIKGSAQNYTGLTEGALDRITRALDEQNRNTLSSLICGNGFLDFIRLVQDAIDAVVKVNQAPDAFSEGWDSLDQDRAIGAATVSLTRLITTIASAAVSGREQ